MFLLQDERIIDIKTKNKCQLSVRSQGGQDNDDDTDKNHQDLLDKDKNHPARGLHQSVGG